MFRTTINWFRALPTPCTANTPKSPAYLRVHGQPVWFIYQVWDDWLTPELAEKYVNAAERQVGDVYWIFDKLKATATAEFPGAILSIPPKWLSVKKIDCFGTYSLFGNWRETDPHALAQLYQDFTGAVHRSGHQVELPVLPGHNNTAVNPDPYVVPRQDGKVMEGFFHAVDTAGAGHRGGVLIQRVVRDDGSRTQRDMETIRICI